MGSTNSSENSGNMEEKASHQNLGTKLPGFGLPISHFPPTQFDSNNNRRRFPHAIADACDSVGVSVRERRMLDFINQITDKPDWEKKVFDEAIVLNWRTEACVRHEDLDDDYLSGPMFDYCLKELRDKAEFYKTSRMVPVWDCEAAVVKSDVIVPEADADELRQRVRVLEDVPEQNKDWHPGSGQQVLDLLHPSLFPLIYERSRALKFGTVPLENCSQFIGEGELVGPSPQGDTQLHRKTVAWGYEESLKAWGDFQWLPSDVCFTEDGPQITSYINNLHPREHKELYGTLERFVRHSIPLWNECLSWFETRIRLESISGSDEDFRVPDGVLFHPSEPQIPDHQRSPSEEIERGPFTLEEVRNREWMEGFDEWFDANKIFIQREPKGFLARSHWLSQPEHRPVDLQKDFGSSGLQIIFKLANIHLTPEKPGYEGGSWHIEGALNEHICATALYYYDEENICDSYLAFRQSLKVDDMGMMHEQDRYQSVEMFYGVQNEGPAIQQLGRVLTRPGRLLAFPNILQHQVQPFRLADPSRPGHRKILALFLVDPYVRVLSTANVPPQRKDWWAPEVRKIRPFDTLPLEVFDMIIEYVNEFPLSWEEATDIRAALMDERAVLVADINTTMEENTFNFCEH